MEIASESWEGKTVQEINKILIEQTGGGLLQQLDLEFQDTVWVFPSGVYVHLDDPKWAGFYNRQWNFEGQYSEERMKTNFPIACNDAPDKIRYVGRRSELEKGFQRLPFSTGEQCWAYYDMLDQLSGLDFDGNLI